MLPPPVEQAGPPAPPGKPRAGLAVLVVALAVLLGLVALVWWINERDRAGEPWPPAPTQLRVDVAPA